MCKIFLYVFRTIWDIQVKLADGLGWRKRGVDLEVGPSYSPTSSTQGKCLIILHKKDPLVHLLLLYLFSRKTELFSLGRFVLG